MDAGVVSLPHPDKPNLRGEDAHFVAANGLFLGICLLTGFPKAPSLPQRLNAQTHNARCAGVADGVGAWADVGVDSGEYSRMLMARASAMAEGLEPTPAALERMLKEAHSQTHVRGSSTACILAVGDGQLHARNLGDSGFLLVRHGKLLFASPQQQHHFNFPFQLGSPGTTSTPAERAQVRADPHTRPVQCVQVNPSKHSTSPLRVQPFSMQVRTGDIIVLGTDGLLDNVFNEESAALVSACKERGASPAAAAEALGRFAASRASDSQHMSPFAYAAHSYGFHYLGGKLDDITVLVAYVTQKGQ